MALSKAQAMEFLYQNRDTFGDNMIDSLATALSNSTLEMNDLVHFRPLSTKTAMLLSVLLGTCGADRFYCRQYISGFVKLITCGGFFWWWIIDIFLVKKNVRKANSLELLSYARTGRLGTNNLTLDKVKAVVTNKEVQQGAKDVWKSVKELGSTMEMKDEVEIKVYRK